MGEMIPDQQGRLVVIRPANPIAGANLNVVQTVRTRWRVFSVKFRFVAAVGGAARSVILDVTDGTDILMRFSAASTILASETWVVDFYSGGHVTSTTGSRVMKGVLPQDLYINDEMHIETAIVNIQGGDQISKVFILVEEWIEPLV